MSSDEIERVARAICISNDSGDPCTHENVPRWSLWENEAKAALAAMRPVSVDRELEFAWTREGEILVGYNPRSEEGGWVRVGVVTKAVSKIETERDDALKTLAEAREKIATVNAALLSVIEGVKAP